MAEAAEWIKPKYEPTDPVVWAPSMPSWRLSCYTAFKAHAALIFRGSESREVQGRLDGTKAARTIDTQDENDDDLEETRRGHAKSVRRRQRENVSAG